MNLGDAYYEFSLLMNKNSERKDIQIDKLNYIVLYNRESQRYLAEFIERNGSTDNINTISHLLIDNYKLERTKTNSNSVEYSLPKDMFQLLVGNSYSNVSSTKCKGEKGIVYNYFKKPNHLNIQLEDQFTKPSFGWERGLGDLYKDKIVIYKTDFDIEETYITYYKVPELFSLDNPDFDQPLELSSYTVGQINDRIVSEVYREFNSQGYNLAKTRETITV